MRIRESSLGFASPDSDYDVRSIYAHSKAWYLSIDVETRRGVIEYPIVDEIDCSGWYLRKALHLFARTNGPLFEWLVSPVRYIEHGFLRNQLAEMVPRSAKRIGLCYHYSHRARRNAREYLLKDRVRIKKYFYVLRPLMAIRYIEKYQKPPPIEFQKLVDTVAPIEIDGAIEKLLEIKQNLPESGLGDPISEINEFIESEIERHGDAFCGQGRPDLITGEAARAELNDIFRAVVV